MLRMLLPVIALLAVTVGIAYYRFFGGPPAKTAPPLPAKSDLAPAAARLEEEVIPEEQPSTVESRLGLLESSLKNVSGANQQVQDLQKELAEVKSRLAKLEAAPTQTIQTTPIPTPAPKQAPLYIPLGSAGSSQALDWTSISTLETEIDTNDYPGYANMYLEVSLRAYQANGKAFARLFNKQSLKVYS